MTYMVNQCLKSQYLYMYLFCPTVVLATFCTGRLSIGDGCVTLCAALSLISINAYYPKVVQNISEQYPRLLLLEARGLEVPINIVW